MSRRGIWSTVERLARELEARRLRHSVRLMARMCSCSMRKPNLVSMSASLIRTRNEHTIRTNSRNEAKGV